MSPWTMRMGGWLLPIAVALPGGAADAGAQAAVARILEQDSTRDNLVDPPGYRTGTLGELGAVAIRGEGPPVILVPGIGFGAAVFDTLAAALASDHRVYAITVAGFGGTSAPPAPPPSTSFGEQTWTDGALRGLEGLIAEADEPVALVGHWLTGTQLAVRATAMHPERVRALVLISPSLRRMPPGAQPQPSSLEQRVQAVDQYLAPRWFRTVTRETWDDNNFLPGDYAAHPVLGLRYWRQAFRPPLHVWIRYLNEFFAQDALPLVNELTVPTLALMPDLEGAWHPPGINYLEGYLHRAWDGVENPRVTLETVAGTRVIPWADAPDAVIERVRGFLEAHR